MREWYIFVMEEFGWLFVIGGILLGLIFILPPLLHVIAWWFWLWGFKP